MDPATGVLVYGDVDYTKCARGHTRVPRPADRNPSCKPPLSVSAVSVTTPGRVTTRRTCGTTRGRGTMDLVRVTMPGSDDAALRHRRFTAAPKFKGVFGLLITWTCVIQWVKPQTSNVKR